MDDAAVERAWSLKAECYAAWHREPQRTREAADAMAALAAATPAPVLTAIAGWTEGIALMAEGRLVDALDRLGAAESVFLSIGDEQHAAEVQVPQMGALSFLGREDEVVALGKRALERFLALGDESSAAKVEINVGTSLSRQDRHVEAEQAYRAAADRCARLGDPYLAAMAGIGLANALTWQFRSSAALRAAARARRLARAGGLAILHAQTLEATGQIELNRGRWSAALAAFAHALRLLEAAGASPQRRLECETALADAYAAVHLQDESRGLYARVIEAAMALPAPNEEAYARLQLGRVLGRAGQRAAALEAFALARAAYERLGNVVALQVTALSVARLQLEAGAADAAREMAARAAAALEAGGIRGLALEARALEAAALARGGDAVRACACFEATLLAARDLGAVAGDCHGGLAALALAGGDVPSAREHALQALQRLEAQRAALPADELRAALGDDAAPLHETLIATSLARQDAAGLLVDLERGRSRALAIGLATQVRPPRSRALAGRLAQLRQAWREAMVDDDGARLPSLDADVVRVEGALLEAQRRELLMASTRRTPGTAATLHDAAELERWQAALGPERALVSFHVRGSEVLAVVLTDRDVRFKTAPVGDLADRIAGLRMQIEAARNPALARRHAAQLEERLRSHARSLYEALWVPLAPLIDARADLIVVPHGPLHDLPWPMLHDGARWLVQCARVAVAPSAAVWMRLQQRAPAGRPVRVVVLAHGGAGLAHVAREAAAVARAHGPQSVMLMDRQASASALRKATDEPVDVLHLACHARFRADNPAFSTLHLADGPLPMHELARWRLRTSLVVLSACETGVSRVVPGGEAFGLVRAVLLAGARSVLATHWAVADQATADLIQQFHVGLVAGADPAAALQRAQAEAASRGQHPYYWAAFAVHGAG